MAPPLRRYEQIAAILVRYGFEVAVRDLVPSTIQWRIHRQKPETVNLGIFKRFRLAIQELGPTFIKFGQIMSTRRELVPTELIEELKMLTDKVEPLPFEKIKPVIEDHFGPINEKFIYLNERPFAAASLSQAHHGKLKDGRVVVLKVQRPGIRETIETDLRILQSMADRVEKSFPDLQIYNFPGMVNDFTRQIMLELDFVRDGRNADLLARNMRSVKGVRFPRIYWEYSGSQLLVMEYIKGVRIDKVDSLKKMGVDNKAIALLGFRAYMKQIFEDGFFHGDPHPGNLLVTPQGELAFLDFGLVGVLRPEKRDLLLKMLMAIVDKDVNELVKIFNDLNVRVRDQWVDAFKDELYVGLVESEEYNPAIPNTGAIENVTQTLRKYRLKVPMVAMLMLKVILMLEDDMVRLYPEFDFLKEAQSQLGEIVKNRLLSQVNIRKAGFNIFEAFQSATDLPQNINEALKKISEGSFRFKIAHDDLDRLGRSIDRASYKLLLGMVLASIVVGLSLVVLATREVLTTEYFQLTLIIYVLAIIVGVYSVYHLIRDKK